MATPETTFCPNCGERISARARFCPSCGARQEDFHVPPLEAAETAPTEITPPAEAAPTVPIEEADELSSPVETPARPAEEAARALWAAGDPKPEPPPPREAAPPEPEAVREQPPPPPEAKEAPPPRERFGRIDPQAAELTELLRERLAVPGIVAAGIAALIAAAIVFVAGLVLAAITPDASILGVMGQGAGLVTEAFRQAVGTLLAPVGEAPNFSISGRLDPMILAAIPIGAIAFATRNQLHRTAGARPYVRLAWAAAVAVPFAVLMLAFAVLGGSTDSTGISTDPGGAFALGLLWGVVGALLGAGTKLPLEQEDRPGPQAIDKPLAAAKATLRPLAAVLVACTVAGLAGWLIQVARGVDEVRFGRSAPTALIEEAAFAGEHGIQLVALSGGALFHADAPGALGLPFPVEQAADVPGPDGGLRIFSYNDALPGWVLLPALILLLGLVALGALYAGFAAAQAAEATSLGGATAWGALTGPVWAVSMAILTALTGGAFHGDASGPSVFGVFLLGGLILGATGGALAESARETL